MSYANYEGLPLQESEKTGETGKKVYTWPLFARHFIVWIFPLLVIFILLSFLVQVVFVIPNKYVLHNYPHAQCYTINITRTRVDPNNGADWYTDNLFVGYNLSATNNNNNNNNQPSVNNNTTFEHYGIIQECKGSYNESCESFIGAETWLECLYNPSNYSDIIFENQAKLNVDVAEKIFLLTPFINVLTALGFVLVLFMYIRCRYYGIEHFMTEPHTQLKGSSMIENLDMIQSALYRRVLGITLEQKKRSRQKESENIKLKISAYQKLQDFAGGSSSFNQRGYRNKEDNVHFSTNVHPHTFPGCA